MFPLALELRIFIVAYIYSTDKAANDTAQYINVSKNNTYRVFFCEIPVRT